MFFALIVFWAANEMKVWRSMRELQGLSDRTLVDIGLSRAMIGGAARCRWSLEAQTRW
jgi:uncharacterized protein YjiS (DUF1127 family)